MFDSVVIGSSPQLMLTAIDLVQKGERVLVIEKSSSLGGAWRGTSFSSYDDVEIGPHFIKPYKNVYEQLIKMGVELLPLKPQPYFLIYKDYLGPIRLNYGARRYLEGREKIGFLKLFWIWIKTHPSVRRKSKDSYMYFKNGSPFFMDRLACYLMEIGGKIQTSSRVIDIEKKGKNYLTITCLNGAIKTVLKARKLYISRSFDLLKNLNFEIKNLKNIDRQKHREVLIEYYGNAPTFSLVTIDNNQSIIKMVSVQKVNREENRNVLAIRLKAEIKHNSLNDVILRELSKFKLIEKNSQILVSKKIDYEVYSLRDAPSLEMVDNGKINIVQTYEISGWLRDYFFGKC